MIYLSIWIDNSKFLNVLVIFLLNFYLVELNLDKLAEIYLRIFQLAQIYVSVNFLEWLFIES